MAKQITVRGVSAELSRRLEALSQRRGESLNATVLHLLEQATGVSARRTRLKRYTTWTADDVAEFSEALAAQRRVDERDWE